MADETTVKARAMHELRRAVEELVDNYAADIGLGFPGKVEGATADPDQARAEFAPQVMAALAAAEAELESLRGVQRLSLEKGDVLVMTSPRSVMLDEAANLTRFLRSSIGREVPVIVMDQGKRLDVLYVGERRAVPKPPPVNEVIEHPQEPLFPAEADELTGEPVLIEEPCPDHKRCVRTRVLEPGEELPPGATVIGGEGTGGDHRRKGA